MRAGNFRLQFPVLQLRTLELLRRHVRPTKCESDIREQLVEKT